MKKRIGFLLVMLVMLVILLTVSAAMADNVRKSGLYTYEIKGNGTLTISDFDWNANSGDVFIPNMIDGYTVTAIGEKAFSREVFDKKGACTVRLPDTIVQIGEFAFQNSPITFIHIPKSVQMIADGAFANCQNMLKFSVDENNPTYATIDSVLFHKQKKQLIAYPYAKGNDYAIPEGIVSIANYAFFWEPSDNGNKELWYDRISISSTGQLNLLGLKWPTTLREVGDYAFCNSKISSIPDNIERIGNSSFAGCSDSSPVKSGESDVYRLNTIGEKAFQNFRTKDMYSVVSVKEVPAYAFENFGIVVSIKEGCEIIGEGAFSRIDAVRYFPSTVKEIGVRAFEGTYIETDTIHISSAVSEISDYAFSLSGKFDSARFGHKDTLKEVVISEGCTRIGVSAFANYEMLEKVEIPSTVTEIGENAFADCKNLSIIKLPTSINKIGDNAFEKEYITLIVEPYSYAELWANENGYTIQGKAENTDWLNN